MKNVIVGQSGGPSSVINSSLAGVYCRAKAMGADKVYGMRNGIQGFLEERLVDLDTVLGSNELVKLLRKTPAAFPGSCRFKLPDPEKDKIVIDQEYVKEKFIEKIQEEDLEKFII